MIIVTVESRIYVLNVNNHEISVIRKKKKLFLFSFNDVCKTFEIYPTLYHHDYNILSFFFSYFNQQKKSIPPSLLSLSFIRDIYI